MHMDLVSVPLNQGRLCTGALTKDIELEDTDARDCFPCACAQSSAQSSAARALVLY